MSRGECAIAGLSPVTSEGIPVNSPVDLHIRDGDRRLDACGVRRFGVAATADMGYSLDLLGSMTKTAASVALKGLVKDARARLGARMDLVSFGRALDAVGAQQCI